MEKNNTKNIYLNKLCEFCIKNKNCDHSFIYEEHFLNGINNIRCTKYQYKKIKTNNENEVETNE